MRYTVSLIGVLAALVTGCVSSGVHTQTVSELEQARKQAADLKKQSAADLEQQRAQNARVADELVKAQQRAGELTEQLAKNEERTNAVSQEATRLSQELTEQQQRATQLASELEKAQQQLTEQTAQVAALTGRVSELTDESGKARAEQDAAQAQLAAATEELSRTKPRLAAATEELSRTKQQVDQLTATAQEAARIKAENEAAAAELRQQQENLHEAQASLAKLRQDQAQLQQDQAEKEREIQRLTQTQSDLAKSLQAEIDRGEIRIQQVADRLTINMVDRVLFESGQGHVKPTGLKVLKQVSDILKGVSDKQIRIEGHTDNVKIGEKLRGKFPTNWELSTMRATSVVRYLVDQGGVNPVNISAVGYADQRPIASNDTEEGRTANRRIEIVLYPKDLKTIVQSAISTAGSSSTR